MGVKDLWQILAPVKREISLENLRGEIVAVDLSVWVCENNQMKAVQGKVTKPHLRNLFFRVTNLIQMGVKPVFIIDGEPPDLKWETMANRINSRFPGKSSKGQKGSLAARGPGRKLGRSHFKGVLKECQELLDILGVPHLQSKGEAEAFAALLNYKGLVDACLTEDGDVFLYGATKVYKNFNLQGKSPVIDCYTLADIQNHLHMDRNGLVALALLLGCDYLPKGVPGVGKVQAMEFLDQMMGVDVLERFQEWRDGVNCRYLEVTVRPRPPHCTKCNHEGSAREHKRKGCPLCENSVCSVSSNQKVCQCPWHLEQVTMGRHNVERDLMRKALEVRGFPQTDIIKEFLHPKDTPPSHISDYRTPNVLLFQSFTEKKLEWTVEYAREKILPLRIYHDLTKHQSSPTPDLLVPIRIVKKRVQNFIPCFEVEWELPETWRQDENESPTIRNIVRQDLFEKVYPKMAADFRDQETKKTTKGKKTKRKVSKDTKLTNPGGVTYDGEGVACVDEVTNQIKDMSISQQAEKDKNILDGPESCSQSKLMCSASNSFEMSASSDISPRCQDCLSKRSQENYFVKTPVANIHDKSDSAITNSEKAIIKKIEKFTKAQRSHPRMKKGARLSYFLEDTPSVEQRQLSRKNMVEKSSSLEDGITIDQNDLHFSLTPCMIERSIAHFVEGIVEEASEEDNHLSKQMMGVSERLKNRLRTMKSLQEGQNDSDKDINHVDITQDKKYHGQDYEKAQKVDDRTDGVLPLMERIKLRSNLDSSQGNSFSNKQDSCEEFSNQFSQDGEYSSEEKQMDSFRMEESHVAKTGFVSCLSHVNPTGSKQVSKKAVDESFADLLKDLSEEEKILNGIDDSVHPMSSETYASIGSSQSSQNEPLGKVQREVMYSQSTEKISGGIVEHLLASSDDKIEGLQASAPRTNVKTPEIIDLISPDISFQDLLAVGTKTLLPQEKTSLSARNKKYTRIDELGSEFPLPNLETLNNSFDELLSEETTKEPIRNISTPDMIPEVSQDPEHCRSPLEQETIRDELDGAFFLPNVSSDSPLTYLQSSYSPDTTQWGQPSVFDVNTPNLLAGVTPLRPVGKLRDGVPDQASPLLNGSVLVGENASSVGAEYFHSDIVSVGDSYLTEEKDASMKRCTSSRENSISRSISERRHGVLSHRKLGRKHDIRKTVLKKEIQVHGKSSSAILDGARSANDIREALHSHPISSCSHQTLPAKYNSQCKFGETLPYLAMDSSADYTKMVSESDFSVSGDQSSFELEFSLKSSFLLSELDKSNTCNKIQNSASGSTQENNNPTNIRPDTSEDRVSFVSNPHCQERQQDSLDRVSGKTHQSCVGEEISDSIHPSAGKTLNSLSKSKELSLEMHTSLIKKNRLQQFMQSNPKETNQHLGNLSSGSVTYITQTSRNFEENGGGISGEISTSSSNNDGDVSVTSKFCPHGNHDSRETQSNILIPPEDFKTCCSPGNSTCNSPEINFSLKASRLFVDSFKAVENLVEDHRHMETVVPVDSSLKESVIFYPERNGILGDKTNLSDTNLSGDFAKKRCSSGKENRRQIPNNSLPKQQSPSTFCKSVDGSEDMNIHVDTDEDMNIYNVSELCFKQHCFSNAHEQGSGKRRENSDNLGAGVGTATVKEVGIGRTSDFENLGKDFQEWSSPFQDVERIKYSPLSLVDGRGPLMSYSQLGSAPSSETRPTSSGIPISLLDRLKQKSRKNRNILQSMDLD